jgi:hypothetical protein
MPDNSQAKYEKTDQCNDGRKRRTYLILLQNMHRNHYHMLNVILPDKNR